MARRTCGPTDLLTKNLEGEFKIVTPEFTGKISVRHPGKYRMKNGKRSGVLCAFGHREDVVSGVTSAVGDWAGHGDNTRDPRADGDSHVFQKLLLKASSPVNGLEVDFCRFHYLRILKRDAAGYRQRDSV